MSIFVSVNLLLSADRKHRNTILQYHCAERIHISSKVWKCEVVTYGHIFVLSDKEQGSLWKTNYLSCKKMERNMDFFTFFRAKEHIWIIRDSKTRVSKVPNNRAWFLDAYSNNFKKMFSKWFQLSVSVFTLVWIVNTTNLHCWQGPFQKQTVNDSTWFYRHV